MLDKIGLAGQEKLAGSSAIVVGAGGLGSPALTYLAQAGVGRIGIIDSDTVALSNLNRQFLHGDADIGRKKAASAKESLCAMNESIIIEAFDTALNGQNAEAMLFGYDIVLGAVDSFETRFVINQACCNLRTPYIDGGIDGFSGCVMFSSPDTPCLRCVFPEQATRKASVGVLGATAGVIGTIEANLAIIHLLGLPNPAKGKLLLYDGFRMSMNLMDINRNEKCPVCGKPVS